MSFLYSAMVYMLQNITGTAVGLQLQLWAGSSVLEQSFALFVSAHTGQGRASQLEATDNLILIGYSH